MSDLLDINWRHLYKWILILVSSFLSLYDFVRHIEEPSILRMSIVPFIFLLSLKILFIIFRVKSERVLSYTPFLSVLVLVLGAPEITYVIFSLFYLCFKPLEVKIKTNILDCFSLNNLKYIHYALFISIVSMVIVFVNGFPNEKVLFFKVIHRILPVYLIYFIYHLGRIYLQNKVKEDDRTKRKLLLFSDMLHISWKNFSSWIILNSKTFVCIIIVATIYESTQAYILKILASILLGFIIGIPIPIAMLFYSFPNVIFSILSLILIWIFREDVKKFLKLDNIIHKNFSQLLVILFFSFTIENPYIREWAIRLIYLLGPWYIICLVMIIIHSYRKSKQEEEFKTEQQIKALFKIFDKHEITETTYLVICPSCGGENLLELGQGESCDYCGCWLSRKERDR